MITCSKCKKNKIESAFQKCSQRKNGYSFYCKSCCSEIQKKRKETAIDRKRKYHPGYAYDPNMKYAVRFGYI